MAPPDAITTTDVGNEIRALRPTAIIPVDEHVESEDETSVNRNEGEDIPPVGEPGEAPIAEETDETEEVSDSSINPLFFLITSPIATREEQNDLPPSLPVLGTGPSNTYHIGESSRGTTRPRQDDPYMNFIPRQRINSPERVNHYTTPARYSLSGDPYALPTAHINPQHNPDFNLQMYRELQLVQGQQRDILNRQDFLERMAAYDFNRVSFRLDGFEMELMRLRDIVRELGARLTRLEDANRGRRM